MGLLTEKYKAWAKHPENYTAKQVLNQIVSDLKWLDDEQSKNSSIPDVIITPSFQTDIEKAIDMGNDGDYDAEGDYVDYFNHSRAIEEVIKVIKKNLV